MATRPLHAVSRPNSRWGSHGPRVRGWLGVVGAAFRSSAAVNLRSQAAEHGYFFAAAGCADGAGFVHSVFTGLLVMAGTFLAIEWRVSRGA